MSPLEAVLVALAGVAAGTINAVVGSGTLITFPTLLAFGVPPVTANVSNTIGLVPGFPGVWASAWLTAWLVAFPVVLVVAPMARRLVQKLLVPA